MAFESPRVRSDAVEAQEFPHLVMKYGLIGVPKTIINEDHAIEGMVPEAVFVRKVMDAVGSRD
jgi:predicted DsbA family dithiol-disulfide isomerase